jgi:hypothetical protein
MRAHTCTVELRQSEHAAPGVKFDGSAFAVESVMSMILSIFALLTIAGPAGWLVLLMLVRD